MGTHVRERERHVREFVMVDQARLRERIEATIEAMIAMLDELEGDPDLEEDDPDDASWNDPPNQDAFAHTPGLEDDEPSLAATNPSGMDYSWPHGLKTPGEGWYSPLGDASQEHWAQGDTHHGVDLEEEHDGREPEQGDEEPSLGWTDDEAGSGSYASTMQNR